MFVVPVADTGPNMAKDEANRRRWLEWLERISADIHRLYDDRERMRGLLEVLGANPAIPNPGFFVNWVIRLYVQAVVMGVRRQSENRRDSISLGRLLDGIVAHPESLTRESYLAHFEGCSEERRDIAREEFEEAAGTDGPHIKAEIVLRDRDMLNKVAEAVRIYANKKVAHDDPQNAEVKLTFGQIDAALDQLGELLERYTLLLKAASLANVAPTHQFEWRETFTVPWIAPAEQVGPPAG